MSANYSTMTWEQLLVAAKAAEEAEDTAAIAAIDAEMERRPEYDAAIETVNAHIAQIEK